MTTTTPEAPPGGRLLAVADRFRDDLDANTTASVDQMTRAWVEAQKRVGLDIQELLSKVEAARLAGVRPDPAWLYREARLAKLTETILAQLARWTPLASESVRANAYQAARRGRDNARTLTREAALESLPGVDAVFGDVNPDNAVTAMGHLAPDGPVAGLFQAISAETADAATTAILNGVILGQGVDQMTAALVDALDVPRWRAESIARTEALRAYRETSRLTYQRSNVVGTWVWTAALDRRTCPACMVMHGQEFPLTAHLDGHPRCRCAMVPRTLSWSDLGIPGLADTRPTIQPGKLWYAQQSRAVQRSILGPRKFELVEAGDLSLDDLVARTSSPEWGTMRRERSVVEVREKRNANHYDAA